MELFDLHCDTLEAVFRRRESLLRNAGAWDLARFSRYRPGVQVFAFWIDDACEDPWARFRAMYDYASEQIGRCGDRLTPCRTGDDLARARAEGRSAALFSLENASLLAEDPERIFDLFGRGIRILSLTWNGENGLAYGVLSENRGLKPLGRRVLADMEALGMTLDVSHLCDRGFDELAERFGGPMVATHSNARSAADVPRNLTDRQIAVLRDCGGLAGLNLHPPFLSGRPDADFDDVRRHICRFLELGCENVLALGGDLDGASLPRGFSGVESFERLREYLAAKGLSESLLRRIFFENAYDFFRRVLPPRPVS